MAGVFGPAGGQIPKGFGRTVLAAPLAPIGPIACRRVLDRGGPPAPQLFCVSTPTSNRRAKGPTAVGTSGARDAAGRPKGRATRLTPDHCHPAEAAFPEHEAGDRRPPADDPDHRPPILASGSGSRQRSSPSGSRRAVRRKCCRLSLRSTRRHNFQTFTPTVQPNVRAAYPLTPQLSIQVGGSSGIPE